MKHLDYSKIKYLLTHAMRYLETLLVVLQEQQSSQRRVLSEVEYWIESLSLLRNCLYFQDKYSGQVDLQASIYEIRTELTNLYTISKGKLSNRAYRLLKCAWDNCIKAEKELTK